MLSFWEKNSFLEYDLIIIGAGIVGLSTASTWIEKNPNDKVLILEKGIFPTGASTKNAGFACFGSVSELWQDILQMGESECLQLVEKRWQGLHKLKNRLGEEGIGAKYFGGYELNLKEDKDLSNKINSLNHLLKEIFKENVFELKNDLIQDFEFNSEKVKNLIFNPFEFQIDTGKMMHNLLNYTQKLGVEIRTGTEVLEIQEENNFVNVIVKNTRFGENIKFRASKLAVCSNAFTKELLPDISLKAGRGQVLVSKPINNLKLKGTFHFDEGFYYFRNYGNRIIFGGGRNQDFDTETTTEFAINEKIINDLQDKLANLILPKQDYEIEHTWAGIMAFSENDKKPILEKISDKIALGVRLNGMGIAIGSTLGEELASLFS